MSEDKNELSLSELQLSLMRVLWQRGQASTAEVAEALRAEGRPLAHTTVATLLQRLEKRGLLACDRDARALVYRPCVSEPEVQKSMVSGLLSSLFAGKASALLSHLLKAGDIADEDMAQMRRLLAKGSPAKNSKDGGHD
ncbi:BlaI/MecI/CopY family transcriptional regulator [Paucibacter sp. DJ2R-2]|uniref:BlaI/MecI/CopY family transcriptional regulator n=1 Tax=Paucibacter sp. DJ2R-2 TaxID=2893558 RepID=UPI0021E425DE|nr:BlaI/MecI/CopY family transcriptional regulator [Paucibacter sp. DJ2R-2]MCV2419779.1 BlaI/MecI/CopY family transcriptional regulator [Paucibacter sp. DJ4R-1]MCV2437318.1 BlaI/MecI/CopY family transcriptional regulator [Paucibacter sp. DJ2R-2]